MNKRGNLRAEELDLTSNLDRKRHHSRNHICRTLSADWVRGPQPYLRVMVSNHQGTTRVILIVCSAFHRFSANDCIYYIYTTDNKPYHCQLWRLRAFALPRRLVLYGALSARSEPAELTQTAKRPNAKKCPCMSGDIGISLFRATIWITEKAVAVAVDTKSTFLPRGISHATWKTSRPTTRLRAAMPCLPEHGIAVCL